MSKTVALLRFVTLRPAIWRYLIKRGLDGRKGCGNISLTDAFENHPLVTLQALIYLSR